MSGQGNFRGVHVTCLFWQRGSAVGRISRRRNPPLFGHSEGGLRCANQPYALYYFMRSGEGEGEIERLRFGKPDDEKSQSVGMLLAGTSLFSLILDDLLRFQSTMLRLMANELQSRIDDYEARKRAPKHEAGTCPQ